jgi:hypothetical protein
LEEELKPKYLVKYELVFQLEFEGLFVFELQQVLKRWVKWFSILDDSSERLDLSLVILNLHFGEGLKISLIKSLKVDYVK